MTKKPKLISSIRAKLVSAVAMLLVAMIMVVSSTYAWFTLSTAPEVTGISTQIGANGALEMALLPLSGKGEDITSAAGDGRLTDVKKNVTWGNLVKLEDSAYGLGEITLYPSKLNLNADDTIKLSPLAIPEYGADGRVSTLNEGKAQTGVFDADKGHFYPAQAGKEQFGVRGVGSASGMTDRQLQYRNAKAEGGTQKAVAQTNASTVLNTYGSALANIAIEYGMGADTASYDKTDVAALRALINGTQQSIASIEKAYMYYIAAYAASAAVQSSVSDIQAKAIYDTVTAKDATLDGVMGILADNGVSALPTEVSGAIKKLNATKTQVVAADTALKTLEDELASDPAATFTWNEISGAMTPMANTAKMKINGFAVSEVKANLGALVSSVTAQGGLKVIMESGAGVFADIADHCGDYTASVNIEKVEYQGIVLNNMAARMETKTSENPLFLVVADSAVNTAGAPTGGGTVMPISEFYGYIIDMAFRTNAAESKLLLQTEGTDRIYGNDNANEETKGHGSTMTFYTDDLTFSNDQVKNLMGNLRIVFFEPTVKGSNLGTVLVYAKLDMDSAEIVPMATDDGDKNAIEAPLTLYKVKTVNTYKTDDNGNYVDESGNVLYYKVGDVYYAAGDCTVADGTVTPKADVAAVADANMTGRVVIDTEKIETPCTDDVITPLTQNQVAMVSALVYLDGENMGNDDVSATFAKSLTGKLNLQFASSANLVPMEYAELHTPGTSYDVTVNTPEGVGINDTDKKAVAGKNYSFALTGTAEGTTYTVKYKVGDSGEEKTLTATEGKYTIPADEITGAVTITVTTP